MVLVLAMNMRWYRGALLSVIYRPCVTAWRIPVITVIGDMVSIESDMLRVDLGWFCN